MPDLNLGAALLIALVVLALHTLAVAIGLALRTYSRRRLEDVCRALGRPERADQIMHLDVRTERAVELLAVLSGLVLAALLGAAAASWADGIEADLRIGAAVIAAALARLAAGVLGRVHAERLIDRLWPIADGIRRAMSPFDAASRLVEALAYRWSRRSHPGPRPASVEVEIHSVAEDDETTDADLPIEVRAMLERTIEFADLTVSDLMRPRSAIASRPASLRVEDAVRGFVETGYSRIPLYGVSRDDIVGVLYAKDLMAQMALADGKTTLSPREFARPPLFVPEMKKAVELLDELRSHRIHLAVALDEYGSVSGLITLEDLIEAILGPIDDEFDPPTRPDPIKILGDARYEIDATLNLEELNERLGLHLPTDGDFETAGGLAFNALGRVPEPGAAFRVDGVEFLVLEVSDHAIRLLRLDLNPGPDDARSVGATTAPDPR